MDPMGNTKFPDAPGGHGSPRSRCKEAQWSCTGSQGFQGTEGPQGPKGIFCSQAPRDPRVPRGTRGFCALRHPGIPGPLGAPAPLGLPRALGDIVIPCTQGSQRPHGHQRSWGLEALSSFFFFVNIEKVPVTMLRKVPVNIS